MKAEILVPLYLAIAIGYIFLPIVFLALFETRKPKRVTCPGNGEEAFVRLDAARLCRNILVGGQPLVCDCSRWPERAGCDRACERSLAGAAA